MDDNHYTIILLEHNLNLYSHPLTPTRKPKSITKSTSLIIIIHIIYLIPFAVVDILKFLDWNFVWIDWM